MSFADYRELYRQKLTTADEAVKVIKSGDWVDYGFCAIQPRVLDEALARRAPELEDVKVRGGISLWKPAIFDIEDPARHIIFNSHHMSGWSAITSPAAPGSMSPCAILSCPATTTTTSRRRT